MTGHRLDLKLFMYQRRESEEPKSKETQHTVVIFSVSRFFAMETLYIFKKNLHPVLKSQIQSVNIRHAMGMALRKYLKYY